MRRPADLEVGDAAGLEACATRQGQARTPGLCYRVGKRQRVGQRPRAPAQHREVVSDRPAVHHIVRPSAARIQSGSRRHKAAPALHSRQGFQRASQPFTLNEAITLAWVHGVEVRPFPSTLPQISPLWRAMDRFGTSSARWLPYWSGSGAGAGDESVKVSAYSQPGKALLFVSHLKRSQLSTTLKLDRRRLGLAAGTLRAVDATTGASIALDGDTLPLTFDGMTYRLIEVRDTRFKAPPAQRSRGG
jgi:hypothetical protein